MEAVKAITETVREQTKTLSQSQPTSTQIGKAISPTEHAALFAVINKARLLNGWTMRTAQELDATIRVWHEAFKDYGIPVQHLDELYKRALDVRQTKMRDGAKLSEVPMLDAVLLISQWTGNFGLRAELKQREVDAGRTLGTNAESVCQHCFGSGFKQVEGGVKKCYHE